MPVIATYVASTCVDYNFPLVLPFMGGRRGPVCIGPISLRGLSPLLPPPPGTAPAAPSLAHLWRSSSAASCILVSWWVGVIVFYSYVVNEEVQRVKNLTLQILLGFVT